MLQLDLREPDVLVEWTIAEIRDQFAKVISVKLHRTPTMLTAVVKFGLDEPNSHLERRQSTGSHAR